MDPQAVLELVKQDKTMKEIAHELGVSYSAVQRCCKKSKLKVKKKYSRPGGKYKQYHDPIFQMRLQNLAYHEIADSLDVPFSYVRSVSEANGLGGNRTQGIPIDEINDRLLRFGFDYISGFSNTKSSITVKCLNCGTIFRRRFDMWYSRLESHGHYCPGCTEKNKKELCEREARIKEERLAKIADEKAKAKADLISRQEEERLANHVCKNCGKVYCIGSTGYNSIKYCSEKCMKRWAMRVKNDRRIKRMSSREHDNDITLEKLYGRDKGICYLCGGVCDWTDIDQNGNAQENYPSIDHVIPISKGGKHKWSNIKLAHRGCNQRKRDEIRPHGS